MSLGSYSASRVIQLQSLLALKGQRKFFIALSRLILIKRLRPVISVLKDIRPYLDSVFDLT